MDLHLYLILTLTCLSTTFAECPDACVCDKISTASFIILEIRFCDNLHHLPIELITSDITLLWLSDNNITALSNIDKQVKNVSQIIILELSKNRISEIEVDSLREFTSLKELHLSSNNISNIPNGLFKTLSNLNLLFLSFNPNLILPETGFGTQELKFLFMNDCNLKEIPVKFFDTMPNIKFLRLDNNHISYLGTHLITNFQKMTFVDLVHNDLTMFQPELVTLLNGHDVVMKLNGNPFRCDCQYRDGVKLYEDMQLLTAVKYRSDTDSLYEMQCVLPPESNNNGSLNQELFLKSLDCDVSKNNTRSVATNTSTLVVNSDVNLNMTSYKTLNESTKSNNKELIDR